MPSPDKLVGVKAHNIIIDPVFWACGKETAENLGGLLFNQKTRKFDMMGWLLHTFSGFSTGDFGNHRIPSSFANNVLGRGYQFSAPLNWLLTKQGDDSEDCKAVIFINDDTNIDDATRLERINKILTKYAISASFKPQHKAAPKKDEVTFTLHPKQKDIINDIYGTSTVYGINGSNHDTW